MKELERRLSRLEELAEYKREVRRQHEPYYEVVPWSIMRDEVTVNYFPEGNYQPPKKYEKLPFADVVQWAVNTCENEYVSFSMMSCQEWLFLQSQDESDTLYTADQRQRFKEMWLSDFPELKLLIVDENWKKIAEVIGRLPQHGRLNPIKEGV